MNDRDLEVFVDVKGKLDVKEKLELLGFPLPGPPPTKAQSEEIMHLVLDELLELRALRERYEAVVGKRAAALAQRQLAAAVLCGFGDVDDPCELELGHPGLHRYRHAGPHEILPEHYDVKGGR